MAQLKDLIVNGPTRLIGPAYGKISSADTVPVVNSNANLQFGQSTTIATIAGVAVKASLPTGGYQGPQGPKGTDATGSQGPQGPKGGNGSNGSNGSQGPKGIDGYYIRFSSQLSSKSDAVWTGTSGSYSGVGKTVYWTVTDGSIYKVGDFFSLYGTDSAGNGHLNIIEITSTAATQVVGRTVSAVKANKGSNGSSITGDQGPQGPKGTDATGSQGPQGPKGATGSGTKGDQGPQGPKGETGGGGGQGPQGPAGSGGGSSFSVSTSTSKHYLLGMTGTGTMSSSNTHLSPTGIYWSSSNLYASSDERLKNFKGDIKVDFDKLATIPKKYFTWKTDGTKGPVNIGTSAQKLEKVYPELVNSDDKGNRGVAYDKLSIVALAAIDKLHEENVELKKEIAELKEEIKRLGLNNQIYG